MDRYPRASRTPILLAAIFIIAGLSQGAPAPQSGSTGGASTAPRTSSSSTQSAPKTATTTRPPAGPRPMTNSDVMQMAKAKLSDDIIIAKIQQSRTRFDTSVTGLVALKNAGVSDNVVSVMMKAPSNPPAAGAGATSASGGSSSAGRTSSATTASGGSANSAAPRGPLPPASNGTKDVVPTNAREVTAANKPAPKPVIINEAPANYGVYIVDQGKLVPLGRIQTKVQVSKFRSLLKSVVPFVRQKVDINIPGAHSTSRFENPRPTFYAYFPPSRDVSKFKLLQCKITGQNFDQRTVANASIMFSTEQNQDEVLMDIGPTNVKDFYRLFPREDLPGGEFGFVEGDTGSKSTSNIEILDVYDFGLDSKEEKMGLKDYLATLPGTSVGDQAFLSWTKEDAQKIVDDREAKTGVTGSMLGWFKRQYASLEVYWADPQFARAFARLEMLDKDLSPAETNKLASLLISPDNSNYYVLVSIGTKIGSGKLIGANEGERLMRPFDASLTSNKGKDVVPAKHLEFVGGYAGLWKVTFDQKSIRGPLLNNDTPEVAFDSRLNQNLEFRATFQTAKILNPGGAATGN